MGVRQALVDSISAPRRVYQFHVHVSVGRRDGVGGRTRLTAIGLWADYQHPDWPTAGNFVIVNSPTRRNSSTRISVKTRAGRSPATSTGALLCGSGAAGRIVVSAGTTRMATATSLTERTCG